MDRREFTKLLGATGLALVPGKAAASDPHPHARKVDGIGVLVDTTLCIGCRKCEWACNQSNNLPEQPLSSFENKSAFTSNRRPDAAHYTVVNESRPDGEPIWAKVQCMHCQDPACASACIVTAFDKRDDGVVAYDASRCMGCRYCIVSCPFQIPAYEYDNALTPQVRKCTFCLERLDEGRAPACVSICPVECLTYGRRDELIALAHRKIARNPDRYIDHVYGEHEVGGTSWLYLSSVPMTELDFPELGDAPVPCVTETIQHSIFKNFVPPLALYAFLGQIMWLTRDREQDAEAEGSDAVATQAVRDQGGTTL